MIERYIALWIGQKGSEANPLGLKRYDYENLGTYGLEFEFQYTQDIIEYINAISMAGIEVLDVKVIERDPMYVWVKVGLDDDVYKYGNDLDTSKLIKAVDNRVARTSTYQMLRQRYLDDQQDSTWNDNDDSWGY